MKRLREILPIGTILHPRRHIKFSINHSVMIVDFYIITIPFVTAITRSLPTHDDSSEPFNADYLINLLCYYFETPDDLEPFIKSYHVSIGYNVYDSVSSSYSSKIR